MNFSIFVESVFTEDVGISLCFSEVESTLSQGFCALNCLALTTHHYGLMNTNAEQTYFQQDAQETVQQRDYILAF